VNIGGSKGVPEASRQEPQRLEMHYRHGTVDGIVCASRRPADTICTLQCLMHLGSSWWWGTEAAGCIGTDQHRSRCH